jgi:outer membrane lipoprotein-sorting protein
MISLLSRVILTLTAFFLPLGSFQPKNDFTCEEVLEKSFKAIREIKGLKYHLKIIERGKKGFNYYESWVKFIKQPRQIYLYIKGIEVLYLDGKNNNKALVNPGGFPYITLNLDPMGDLMRQDQHHTLNEMGYDYFSTVIQQTLKKVDRDHFDEYFKLVGEEKVNNRLCYKIIINNKDFSYKDYTVQAGESITSIARKFFVSEYMILEKNPKFKDYFDPLKKGQVIKVPNSYCKSVILYIDKFYFVPISVKVIDDKGLFEEYNYHFLQVNPKFEEDEFTRNYRDYKF